MESKGGVCFSSEQPYRDLIQYFKTEYLLERALEVTDFAIHQFQNAVEFYLKKAELLLQNKQTELALSTLDLAVSIAPDNLEVHLLRAEAFAALDLHLEAVSLLDSLKTYASAEDLSAIYVQESLIYHYQSDYEKEFFYLKSALKENPGNSDALSRMWFCVEASGKYEESVILHEQLLEDDPFCSLAWFNLGAAHQYLCNHQQAIESFEYAFLTHANFEFAYRSCADVCLYTNNYQKALQCYQEVLERFEPDEDLFLNIGLCHEKLENFAIARSFYEKVTLFNPLCDEALFHIGQCYAGQKRWHKAIKSYLKAIRIEDNSELYYSALGEAYYQTGKYKKAENFFRLAADIAADDPDYWIRLARFYMDTSQLENAIAVLDEAEEYTYGSLLLYYRSAFLFKMGRKQEALLILEEALCEDFHAHDSLFNLLPVLEKDTEVKAVISIFQPE